MKNLMALFSDYGYNNRYPNDGGNSNMAVGYLASWIGPVCESEDEYNDKSFLSPILNSTLHVQNVIFLNRNNYTDNDAIKHAIMQYGAVSTSMFYDKAYYNSQNKVYHYYTGESSSNHAVAIVGWDDSFEIPNANGTGAWIAKNSWGSNWANDGYFYVSYYDTRFAALNSFSSFTFILNDTERFDKNYQYDPSGHTDYFFVLNNTVWYKNSFNATDDEFLKAVSTYFDKNTTWNLFINVNDKIQLTQSGTSNPGYYTINLDYPISLTKGDVFEVIFKITADDDVGFPIAEVMSLNKMTYLPNISYMREIL